MAVSGPVTRTSDDNAEPEPVECELCRFFKPEPNDMTGGECRRYPPPGTRVDVDGVAVPAPWPIVEGWDWCGEFKPLRIVK